MAFQQASPVFETGRLLLLAHTEDDWLQLHRMASDPDIMRFITGGVPFEPERTRGFVPRQGEHLARYGFCRWKLVLRETGEYLGFCGAEYKTLDGERVPEIGWWIAKKHWGQGYATEAAHCAFAHVWDTIGIPRLASCAFPENAPSLRVMEKIGLQFEKHFDEPSPLTGEIFRLVMYSKTR